VVRRKVFLKKKKLPESQYWLGISKIILYGLIQVSMWSAVCNYCRHRVGKESQWISRSF